MDYIADKDLYKAVMFACSMLRKNSPLDGYDYMRCIRTAANYYGVSVDDVKFYVSQRSGQKRGRAQTHDRYYWFTCVRIYSDDNFGDLVEEASVRRAKNEKTLLSQQWQDNGRFVDSDCNAYIRYWKALKRYDTKKEAEDALNSDFEEYCKKEGIR